MCAAGGTQRDSSKALYKRRVTPGTNEGSQKRASRHLIPDRRQIGTYVEPALERQGIYSQRFPAMEQSDRSIGLVIGKKDRERNPGGDSAASNLLYEIKMCP